ncbi:hypothetical protein LCGC14_3004100, partial [marine sediment metagenome]
MKDIKSVILEPSSPKEESAATSSPSVTKTAEGDVENSSDSNEPPMPPKEPIPDTTGWSPKK